MSMRQPETFGVIHQEDYPNWVNTEFAAIAWRRNTSFGCRISAVSEASVVNPEEPLAHADAIHPVDITLARVKEDFRMGIIQEANLTSSTQS